MDIKELRQKSPVELKRILDAEREKIRDLRFKIASKQIKNVREIREAKKTVSRILLLLGRNQPAGKKSAAPAEKKLETK